MRPARHDQLIAQAFTDQAESFNRSATANAAEILDAIVAASGPKRDERWLETACGPGIIARRFATQAGSVHGIDVTEAMIAMARREAAGAGIDNVSFELGDATATGLPDACFDGAVSRFSVHHIPLPGRMIDELARVVRPGGRIAIADHLADRDAESRSWALEVERLRDPSHWASLSDLELRELGSRAGLELTHEERFAYELEFEDWLARGTDSEAAHELVEQALLTRPGGTECFQVEDGPAGRILRLQLWLGVWRR
jgi:ubiquinone/menaquinone biosynthesis C-methylase UbiE